jgi:hypothetical protein
MRLCILLNEWHGAVGARSHPPAAIEPGSRIRFVPRHGDRGARFQGKGDHAGGTAGLKFQFFGERWHEHAPRRVATLSRGAGITGVLGVGVGRARHHLLRVAVPPGVGNHSVRRWESSSGNGGVPDASFRGRVGIGCIAKPSPFIDQPLQAAGPLAPKFVDVIAAHLVDHEEHDQLGALRKLGSGRCFGGLRRRGDCQNQ